MVHISIRRAENAEDHDIARALCREWLEWHWNHYPADWPTGPDHPMHPDRFESVLQALPELHRRPRGGILIGSVDGQDAGCVMYHEAEDGVAEFNRMFVSGRGRGHGLGRLMLDEMFESLIADGYRKVFFSSATFLTHARAMYEGAGFTEMAPPAGLPVEWRDRVYFMERPLV
jgi:GNAT superfamily N-acetyltransferase